MTYDNLIKLENDSKLAIESAVNLEEIEHLRIKYLGKKGELTDILKILGTLQEDERKSLGKTANITKEKINSWILDKAKLFEEEKLKAQLKQDVIDITLPGRGQNVGTLHPVSLALDRIVNIFNRMGFVSVDGPEIEDEYHNFEALNTPKHHPARAMHDTFYFEDRTLLRTQTTAMQIRYLETHKPPVKMISIGKVYRRDFDASHTPMFHQLEGLLVDEGVSMANLKSVLGEFLNTFFGRKLKIRFRPSYFPFTEPSAEVDVECVLCSGKGCRVCKNSGWLEVLGSGMVHPAVLENIGIDSDKYSGYAFGVGIDRLALLFYKINDLRLLFENDLRFLEQF